MVQKYCGSKKNHYFCTIFFKAMQIYRPLPLKNPSNIFIKSQTTRSLSA